MSESSIPGTSLHRELPVGYHARDGVAIPKRCAAARQPSARRTVRDAKASRSREAILPSNRRSSRYVELGGLWNPAAKTLLHNTFGRIRSNQFLCQSCRRTAVVWTAALVAVSAPLGAGVPSRAPREPVQGGRRGSVPAAPTPGLHARGAATDRTGVGRGSSRPGASTGSMATPLHSCPWMARFSPA